MKKTPLLLLIVLALLGSMPIAFAQDAVDPSEVFLKAYMTAQQADKLERDNQLKPALEKLRFAGTLLEELKKSSADWQPAIVDYRSRKISESILRVESKISTQHDLSESTAAAVPAPEPEAPGIAAAPSATAEPTVELGGNIPPSAATQKAIQEATKELRARIDSLEIDLKTSHTQVETAQKEKAEVVDKLRESTAALDQAKNEAAKSAQAEQEVRDQLAAAQKSLGEVQQSGGNNQKATLALKGEITQLKKALDAAQAGRTAAEKESSSIQARLADANKKFASVSKERDAMQRERDDALKQLKASSEAQAKVQALVAENADLQQRLTTAVTTVREISEDKPRKEKELREVKEEMEKLRTQLVASQKQNQDSDKTIADLRSQLDDASGALAAAKLNGANSEESAQLVRENQMLRGIVIRERQEEARREQAKKLMLAEFDKLKIKSGVLDEQIRLLAEPITKLSDEELALLRKPVVALSDNNPASIKASLTMAKPDGNAPATGAPPAATAAPSVTAQASASPNAVAPSAVAQASVSPSAVAPSVAAQASASPSAAATNVAAQSSASPSAAPITVTNATPPPSEENTADSSLQSVAQGDGNKLGPEVETTVKPGVPSDLLPLAREAKSSFDHGKFKDAETEYQQILAKSPNNIYSLSNLGVVFFRNGKLKAAELTLKKAIALAPRDEFTHTTLGIVYYRQSKFDDALSELTKSLAINPKSATAHNYLGITASQKGWQEAAEKEMLEAIANNPDYADAHFNLAVVYSTSQPPAKELARRHYEKALALGAAPDPTLDKLLGR